MAAASLPEGLLMGVTGLGILLCHSPLCPVGGASPPLLLARDSSEAWVSPSSEPAVESVSEAFLRSSSSADDREDEVPAEISRWRIQRPCCFFTTIRARSSCTVLFWSRAREVEREEERSDPVSSSETASTGIRLFILTGLEGAADSGGTAVGSSSTPFSCGFNSTFSVVSFLASSKDKALRGGMGDNASGTGSKNLTTEVRSPVFGPTFGFSGDVIDWTSAPAGMSILRSRLSISAEASWVTAVRSRSLSLVA